jgi:HlyD family secretion protein
MPIAVRHGGRLAGAVLLLAAALVALRLGWQAPLAVPASGDEPAATADLLAVRRLTGLTEAAEAFTVVAPRLAGQAQGPLTIVRLAPKGSRVRAGDLLVEFDRQAQQRAALDRRAEWRDLEEQFAKRRAEIDADRVKDETELLAATNAVAAARLDLLKNDLLPPVEAEKNTLALEAATARLALLRETLALRRRSAAADLRILEIRRDRAALATRQAEHNAERMAVHSSIEGMVVLKSVWKSGQFGEVQDGEEVRPGTALLDVVNPARMRVRARVNQNDIEGLRAGMAAEVTLDAYPGRRFHARLDRVAPIARASQFSDRVRTFTALFSVTGSDPILAPDLTAAVDVEVGRGRDDPAAVEGSGS